MCIALATTAHPCYALIILNNRDEYIHRPTSRPHWYSSSHQTILSARDLRRPEQGTWLGITKHGKFAVLTNYREPVDSKYLVQGTRSRGAMVSAWLTGCEENTEGFVNRVLDSEGVKGVGGFSLICGNLRRKRDGRGEERQLEPLAVISNRHGRADDVLWIGGKRGGVYGLSNTFYDDPVAWPKVQMGKEKVLEVIEEAVREGLEEGELLDRLFGILDIDTLPEQDGEGFEEYLYHLRKSIFIPKIGPDTALENMPKADQIAAAHPVGDIGAVSVSEDIQQKADSSAPHESNRMTGIYGTQRQTIVLVDWDGHVTFLERTLYDSEGNALQRGEADMRFDFKIEDWDSKT